MGQVSATLEHAGQAVCWSPLPGSSLLVAASAGPAGAKDRGDSSLDHVTLYDADSEQTLWSVSLQIRELARGRQTVRGLTWSPDGSTLAIAASPDSTKEESHNAVFIIEVSSVCSLNLYINILLRTQLPYRFDHFC